MSTQPLTLEHFRSYPNLPISNEEPIELVIPDTPQQWYLEPSTNQYRTTSQMCISDTFLTKRLSFSFTVNNEDPKMNPSTVAAIFLHEIDTYKGDTEFGFIYYPSTDSLHFFQVINANLSDSIILKELLVSKISGHICKIKLRVSRNGNFYIKLTSQSTTIGVQNIVSKHYISKAHWMPNMYKRPVMLTGTIKKLKDSIESSKCTLYMWSLTGTK